MFSIQFKMRALIKNIFLLLIFSFIGNARLYAQSSAILGMTGGMGITRLRYNSYDESLYNFKQTASNYFGVSLEFPVPKTENRGTFYNELAFFRFKSSASLHTADSVNGNPENSYYDVNLEFEPNIITLAHMFRYSFTPGNFRYFVSAGIYNNFVISAVNRKTTVHTLNGVSAEPYHEDAVTDFAVHGLMITAGTGFIYKNIGLEIRFDPGRNFTKLYDCSVYSMTFSALLHVRFNP